MRRLVLLLTLVLGAGALTGCGLSWSDPFHPQSSKR